MQSDLFFYVTKCPVKNQSKVIQSETSSLPLGWSRTWKLAFPSASLFQQVLK